MIKKIKTYISLLILALCLTSCSSFSINSVREDEYLREIKLKDKKIEEINQEKELMEENMEVFLELREIDNKSFLALEREAGHLIIDLEGKDQAASRLDKMKNIIKELPQNLVFEKTLEDDETRVDMARSHRQRDDLLVNIESSGEEIKYITIVGSIQTEEKTRDTLLLMSMILEEIFLNRSDISDYIDSYIEGIDNKMYKENYNLDGKIMEFRTSNDPKEKLYGHISLNIIY